MLESSSLSSIYPQSTQLRKIIKKNDQQKQKRGRKPKNVLKKIVYGFNQISKQFNSDRLDMFSQLDSSQPLLLKTIPIQKVFFLAGDILVELKGSQNEYGLDLFNKFRNTLYLKNSKEAISFEMESIKPLKDLSAVIYYLEHSQDQYSYEFSQFLKSHQQVIYKLSDQIQNLQSSYLSGFEELVQQRDLYKQKQRDLLVKQLANNDEFSIVATISLSFVNQAATISNISIAKSMISLLGAEDDDLVCDFLKIGFMKVFGQNSRRQIMKSNALAQQKKSEGIIVEIPDFEITTFDQIKITTQCKFQSIPINYPEDLQFQQFPFLNTIEQFLVVQYQITPQHIEQLLKIRKEYIYKAPQNEIFPLNYQYSKLIEIENFEYTMQSQIFLEKYYQKTLNQINKEMNEQQKLHIQQLNKLVFNNKPCGYKQI